MQDEGALDGLKVLDLSTGLASAYCTKWFADFGAEVILVEDPGHASEVRRQPPFLGNTEGSASHVYLNAGKKSIAVSLRSDQGRSLIHQLARKVDLVVEDAAPDTMFGIGLDFDSLKAHNPALIYVSITPFGHTGPYKDFPATELTLAAWSGTLGVRRISGRRPVEMSCHQSSYIGGRVAFIAAMGAVLGRRGNDGGQHVDVALLEAIAGNDMAAPTTFSYNGISLPPPAEANARGRGGQGTYTCRDGDVNVLPGIGGMKKLAALLGDPGLADHELFRDHSLRARRADEFDQTFLMPYLAKHTRAEIVEAAQNLGMPFSYVLRPEELIDEPQLTAREFFVHLPDPDSDSIQVPGPPVRMSRTSPRFTGRAPRLGESTRDILREWLEITDAEVEELNPAGARHGE
jgi:crotonobetainyl-CoA:carnitine CoA-transferase CaiB-like acyl-CoA transferase